MIKIWETLKLSTIIKAGILSIISVIFFGSFALAAPGDTYTLTVTASAGGSISPSGTVVVDEGDNQTFTWVADPGFALDRVLLDGVYTPMGGGGLSNQFTLYNVTSDHTINVQFATVGLPPGPLQTITASAGPNGSITPDGSVGVIEGDDAVFTFVPDAGYEVDKVKVDGVDVTANVKNNKYTLKNVTAEHTIEVTFRVSLPNGAGGTVPSDATKDETKNASPGVPDTGIFELKYVAIGGIVVAGLIVLLTSPKFRAMRNK